MDTKFSTLLQQKITEYHLTHLEFCERTGFSAHSLHRWLNGKIPSAKTLKNLSEFFHEDLSVYISSKKNTPEKLLQINDFIFHDLKDKQFSNLIKRKEELLQISQNRLSLSELDLWYANVVICDSVSTFELNGDLAYAYQLIHEYTSTFKSYSLSAKQIQVALQESIFLKRQNKLKDSIDILYRCKHSLSKLPDAPFRLSTVVDFNLCMYLQILEKYQQSVNLSSAGIQKCYQGSDLSLAASFHFHHAVNLLYLHEKDFEKHFYYAFELWKILKLDFFFNYYKAELYKEHHIRLSDLTANFFINKNH